MYLSDKDKALKRKQLFEGTMLDNKDFLLDDHFGSKHAYLILTIRRANIEFKIKAKLRTEWYLSKGTNHIFSPILLEYTERISPQF